MTQQPPKNLRIWQQNLNKSLNSQLHLINSIRPTEWDILLIQEPWIGFNGTRSSSHWRVIYPETHFIDNTKTTRSLILVNTNIPTNSYQQIHFKSADVSGLTIKLDDRSFVIINIYNDCNSNDAIEAVSEVLSNKFPDDHIPNSTHVILGGDFNHHHSWWEDDQNRHLTSSEEKIRPLLDLIYHFDLRMALPPGRPTLQAFSTNNWTRPDNVWCSNHSTDLIVRCDTAPELRGPNTDHVPIHVILDVSITRNQAKPSRNFRAVDWTKFSKRVESLMSRAPKPKRIRSITQFRSALDAVNNALTSTVNSHAPLNNPLPHTKRWWNAELSTMRKNKNRAARLSYKWRGLPDHHAHDEHKHVTKEYAKLIEKSKKAHWENWLLNASDRDLWTANKYATDPPTDGGRTRVPNLTHEDPDRGRHIATSNEDKSNALAKSFFPPPPATPIVPISCYPKPDNLYFSYFSKDQIRLAARKLDAYKAPGPDGIPNIVLKECIDVLVDHLYYIFRAIFELETYPEEWKESITVVLRKPGKPSYEEPKAYRPIALLNTLGKLFSSIVADELSYFCESRNLFPLTQFGGRPARTTSDSMLLMTHAIKEAWRNKKVASVLFLDVQGAFPNVVKEVLLHNMRIRGVPSKYICLTQMMLTGRKTKLSFDDFMSDFIAINNGNNQGCPLSMLFYSFYNAGLLELSPPNSHDERQFGFVDDVALLAIGPTLEATHRKLKDMMERPGGAFDWSENHNSQFELSKLALMDFSLKRYSDNSLTISHTRTNRSTSVKSVKAYRFLGVMFDPKLKWSAQQDRAARAAEGWINLVRRLARTSTGISAKAMRKLYTSIAVPKMAYAADVWYTLPHKPSETAKKRLGSIRFTRLMASAQRRATINMLGAMRTTAGDVLNAHAHIPPPHLLFLKSLTRSATRLLSLPENHPLHKPVQRSVKHQPKRHKSPLHQLFHTTEVKPKKYELILPTRRRRNYNTLANVHIEDNRETAIANANATRGLTIFTDGSGYKNMIGAAAVITSNGTVLETLRYRLGPDTEHTVYEGEIFAVILALHILTKVPFRLKKVTIGLDNQAVLHSLQNQRPKPSHYLLDRVHDYLEDFQVAQARVRGRPVAGYRSGRGRTRLKDGSMGWIDWQLESHCKVKFIWTPGHEGIEGNERADEEAKRAAEQGSNARKDLPPFVRRKLLPISISATRCFLKREIKSKWINEWSKSPRYQTASNIDCSLPSNNYVHIIDQLQRNQASLLTQLRTGHVPLNVVLHRIKRVESPECPHCRNGIRETLIHYLLFCPHYDSARSLLTAALRRDASSIPYLLGDRRGIPHLLRYADNTNRLRATFGEVRPPLDFTIKNKEPKKRPNSRHTTSSSSSLSNQNAPS
jgi:ribonuclease HI